MATTLGTVGEMDTLGLAGAMTRRDRICLIALETSRGWHLMGYRSGAEIWKSGPEPAATDPVFTLFAAADGKFIFHRSDSSSNDAVAVAVQKLRDGRASINRMLYST